MMNRKFSVIFIVVLVVFFLLCVISFKIDASADGSYPIKYQVTASSLNVRLNAGTQYTAFDRLSYGNIVYGKQSMNGWTEINCRGFKGFVYSAYLQECGNQAQPGNLEYIGNLYVTGYCWSSSPSTLTANETTPQAGRTVAMAGYPFGTRIYIEGIGYRVVEDRGVGQGCIDIFYDTVAECYAITGYRKVYLVR